jgi:hypothetical protein
VSTEANRVRRVANSGQSRKLLNELLTKGTWPRKSRKWRAYNDKGQVVAEHETRKALEDMFGKDFEIRGPDDKPPV